MELESKYIYDIFNNIFKQVFLMYKHEKLENKIIKIKYRIFYHYIKS